MERDPARQELRTERRTQVMAKARQMPLEVVLATRHAAAGISPNDPALRRAAEGNRAVYDRRGGR